jgi:hypothetical protein
MACMEHMAGGDADTAALLWRILIARAPLAMLCEAELMAATNT